MKWSRPTLKTGKKQAKPDYRDRILEVGSHYYPPEYSQNPAFPEVRALYLLRAPCLQLFHTKLTRYLNFLVRPFENFAFCSHWILLVTPPIPSFPPGTITWSLPLQIIRSIELQVPLPSAEQRPTVAPFDEKYPIRKHPLPKLLYLGVTTYSDREISLLGQLIVEYMKAEGGGRYHRVFRNCQHFVAFMMSFLCPEAPLPTRADQTPLGISGMFKRHKWDFDCRLSEMRDFCGRRIHEKLEVNKVSLWE